MGFYVEVPENKGKADQLVDLHAADRLLGPPVSLGDLRDDETLICVVENAFFDAAAIVYSDAELEAFLPTPTDDRPRTWLTLPTDEVLELNPHAPIGANATDEEHR